MKPFKLFILRAVILFDSTATGCQEVFDAIEKNNLDQVKALVEANPQLVMTKD
jgi:hypothetical protein